MKLEKLYKTFIYTCLISLAISIIVPVSWVFMASLKQDSEFLGSPFTIPRSFYIKIFITHL